MQDVLAYLDSYEEGASQRVRALIPDDVQAAIDATPRRGWIEVEDDIYVPTSIWAVLGDEDAREMMSQFLKSHFENPLLAPLVRSTLKLFGLTPINALRMVPSGWRLIYRGICGVELRVTGKKSAEIVLTDVAEPVIESEAYLGSFRAIFTAVIELTADAADVTIHEIDREARRVTFACEWSSDAERTSA